MSSDVVRQRRRWRRHEHMPLARLGREIEDGSVTYRLSNEELKQAVIDYITDRGQEMPPEGWQKNHVYFSSGSSGGEVTTHAETERPTE